MQASYVIEADSVKGIVRIWMRGFFSPGDAARFQAEKQGAIASLRRGPNQHLTLVDVSECKIQARDVFDTFAAMIVDPRSRSRRLAVVVGSSLARMQARRSLDRPDAQCFDNIAEAETWLFAKP